jgi:cytochrome c5
MARYKAPVTVIVLNNHSYNNERNRIWNSAGRQFEAARDMTCYLGDPDVDFAKTASAFGVEGETVKEPDGLKGAFARAKSAMVEGRPLSARHSHQARRLGRGVGMASALLARRPAHPEGVIMRIPLSGLFALAIATASPSFAQNANPLPPGDGRDIVAVACSQCHYLGTIAKIRDGAGGWRVYVNNMVLRGAQLTAPEIDKVVDYLALNLGPGANLPPTRPVTLPDGHGKDLVETRCGLCHDLERVATIKRRKQDWPVIVANMVTWGATATPEEAQTMTDYLATNFGN